MVEFLKMTAAIVNEFHDWVFVFGSSYFKMGFTDKNLHFWFTGVLGMLLYLFTDHVFKKLAKWSVSAISFVYTMTVLLVLALGLEIEQKITGRGDMEFQDIVYGVWGFLAAFSIYLCLRVAYHLLKKAPSNPLK